ncbi:MAG: response regulator transcription factor [Atopobiaceae bacterium]|nr:response regulator transcription factor [Atopobiaceae bacterium]
MSSILLIEDDKTIRLALGFTLTNAGYELTVATDGAEGLEVARTANPDLILLDVMLPKLSGLEVARLLRNDGNKVPIIMLTALDQETDKVAGLDAGADDYVTKPFSTAELLARIRANMRRQRRANDDRPAQIDAGALHMDLDASRVLVAGSPVKLRKKEYQLLFALASRPGVLCTRQWLSREIWGEMFLPTSRTIDTHVKRLRKAIDRDGWTYIHTEHGMGYRFEPRRAES